MVITNRVTLRGQLHFSQLKYLLIPQRPCPLIQMPPLGVCEPQMLPQRHEVLRGTPKSFQELHFPGELRLMSGNSEIPSVWLTLIPSLSSRGSLPVRLPHLLSDTSEVFLAGNNVHVG